jgi:hypothetical protein
MYSWAAMMIWFTSFCKPMGKDNYLANKQNMMVADMLAVIFQFQGVML